MPPTRRVILAALLLAAAPGLAQAQRPVVTESIDEPGRTPYFQTYTGPPTGADPFIAFDPVPAGKRLVVTFISGRFMKSPNFVGNDFESIEIGSVAFNTIGGLEANYLAPAAEIPILRNPDGVYSRVFASPVLLYFDAGKHPGVQAVGPETIFFSISGYLVSLP